MTTQNKNFKFNKELFMTTFINSVFDGKVDLKKVYVLHGYTLIDILRGGDFVKKIKTDMYLPALLRNKELPDDFKQNVINPLDWAYTNPDTRVAQKIFDCTDSFVYREFTPEFFSSIPTEELKYRYWKKFLYDFNLGECIRDIAHDVFYNTYATIDDKFNVLANLRPQIFRDRNGENWLLDTNISSTDALNVIKTVWKDMKPKIQHAIETGSANKLRKIKPFGALFNLVMMSDENTNAFFEIRTIKDLRTFNKKINDVLPKVLTQTKEDIKNKKLKKELLDINNQMKALENKREQVLLQMAGFNKTQGR